MSTQLQPYMEVTIPDKEQPGCFRRIFEMAKFYLWESCTDFRNRCCGHIWGLLIMFFVCVILAVGSSLSFTISSIMVELSEAVSGEVDIIVTPASNATGGQFSYFEVNKDNEYKRGGSSSTVLAVSKLSDLQPTINTTALAAALHEEERTTNKGKEKYHFTPRISLTALLSLPSLSSAFGIPPVSVPVYLIDTKKEKSLDQGEKFPSIPIPQGTLVYENRRLQAFIGFMVESIGNPSAADVIKQSLAQSVTISYPAARQPSYMIGRLLQHYNYSISDYINSNGENMVSCLTCEEAIDMDRPTFLTNISEQTAPFVLKGINSLNGKAGFDDDFYFLAEMDSFFDQFYDHFDASIFDKIPSAEFRAATSVSNISEFASHAMFSIEIPRNKTYLSKTVKSIRKHLIDYVSELMFILGGSTQVGASTPILDMLSILGMVVVIINVIVVVVVVLMSLFASYIITNFMIMSIEARVFDFGVMRTLGLGRIGMMMLVIVESLMYTTPAFIVGIGISFPLNMVLVQVVVGQIGFVKIDVTRVLSGWSILIAAGVMLLISLFSSIFPIRNVLSKNLQTSIDKTYSKSKVVEVSVERSSDLNLPWNLLFIGLIIGGGGGAIYLILTFVLSDGDLMTLLILLFVVLGIVMVALVLFALNAEFILERLVAFIFLFWENSSIKKVAMKNLHAHRLRNRKVTLIYAMCLAFGMFLMNLSTSGIGLLLESGAQQHPADMHLYDPSEAQTSIGAFGNANSEDEEGEGEGEGSGLDMADSTRAAGAKHLTAGMWTEEWVKAMQGGGTGTGAGAGTGTDVEAELRSNTTLRSQKMSGKWCRKTKGRKAAPFFLNPAFGDAYRMWMNDGLKVRSDGAGDLVIRSMVGKNRTSFISKARTSPASSFSSSPHPSSPHPSSLSPTPRSNQGEEQPQEYDDFHALFYRDAFIPSAALMEEFLEGESKSGGRVKSYGFSYCALRPQMNKNMLTMVENTGHSFEFNQNVIPVSPNFLSIVDGKYLTLGRINKYLFRNKNDNGMKNKKGSREKVMKKIGTLSEQLYLKGRENAVVAASAFKKTYDMDPGDFLLVHETSTVPDPSFVVSTTAVYDSDRGGSGLGAAVSRSSSRGSASGWGSGGRRRRRGDGQAYTTTASPFTLSNAPTQPSAPVQFLEAPYTDTAAHTHFHVLPIYAQAKSFPQYSLPKLSISARSSSQALVSAPTMMHMAEASTRVPPSPVSLPANTPPPPPNYGRPTRYSSRLSLINSQNTLDNTDWYATENTGHTSPSRQDGTTGILTGGMDEQLRVCNVYINFEKKVNDSGRSARFAAEMAMYVERNGGNNSYILYDKYATNQMIDSIKTMLSTVFTIIVVVIMLLCAFALFAAMNSNIDEQGPEIGIMRCVGIRPFPIVRLFVEEAFILVGTAIFIGTVAGMIMTFAFVLIIVAVLNAPMSMSFPWQTVLIMYGMAVVVSVLASSLPTVRQLRKNLVALSKS